MVGNVGVPPGRTIAVVIAHRDDMVRAGLTAALDANDDLAVTGTAATGEDAIALLGNGRPADVLVVDDRLSDMSASQLCGHVHRHHGDVACVVHSTSSVSITHTAHGVEAVPKQLDTTDLTAAIRRAFARR